MNKKWGKERNLFDSTQAQRGGGGGGGGGGGELSGPFMINKWNGSINKTRPGISNPASDDHSAAMATNRSMQMTELL